ncbi:MAG: hypothetical protein K0S86_5143 [Geminicoccaceae bacterium]|jgi:hypothetical protein|nr:hypothetical protein [Geminicoccaceae bacterium]
MDASLYFQLVDAIARIRAPRDLAALAERVAATQMHPLERRVLERALRARSEALDLDEITIRPTSRLSDGTEPRVQPRSLST